MTRCDCSNLQPESQPSRFVVLPSSHCSLPARTESPQTTTTVWHEASHVAVFGGSQVSFFIGSIQPSPHTEFTHTLERQIWFVPHVEPCGSAAVDEHFLPA